MQKITLDVEGMACGMCEAHITDAVRKAFQVKEVASAHVNHQPVVLTDDDVDETAAPGGTADRGYEMTGINKEAYTKKGLLSFLKK